MNRVSPWGLSFEDAAKLKAARAEAKRRYERTSEVRNDDYRKVKNRENARKKLRIPLEAPKMKPWDFQKSQTV